MPNSRFALHGKRPSLIHGLCAFFASNSRFFAPFSGPSRHLSRQPLLCQPLSSRFALHGLRALEVGFWQNEFSSDFYFWAAGIFLLSPDLFSFLWEKVPREILQENPQQNPPKFIQQKSLTHFCRGAGPRSFSAENAEKTKKRQK